jgi:hypothetical protein
VTNTASQGDSRGLATLAITDFSPGIYNNSVIAFAHPAGLFPAPPGAADISATFGCIAEPNGGLGPLPARGGEPATFPGQGLSLNDMGIGITGAADITAMVNTYQSSSDELVFVITDDITGSTQHTAAFSYIVNDNTVVALSGSSATYTFANNYKNFCAYPFETIIAGQVCVILPLCAPGGPNSNLFVYPSLSAPTTYAVSVISSTGSVDGSGFGHQGRVGIIQLLSGYGWPYLSDQRPNEAFNYTDPPQTATWPVQFELFGPENPSGYGAVNSVSAGELFCIKRRGGAIIIQGDLNNPTVTTLPGVQSTGPFYGHAGTDQNGMYYCSKTKGAWLWGGGNTSQKISAQLEDNFFDVVDPITDTTYYGYYCERWSTFMMFSNNWVFNSATGSWWRLEDPNDISYFWYVLGYDSPWLFCAKPSVTGETDKFLYEYDLRVPRSSFTWQSLPLKPPSADRFVAVREVVIRASNPYGDSTPQVIVTLIDENNNLYPLDTWNMEPGVDNVQEVRLNARVAQTSTIAINLDCSGTTYAPVVYGLSLGYRTREHVNLA